MFFEAELKNKKYQINVYEGRHIWKVSLQEEGSDWVHHEINKADYQHMDDAICFLFKNRSYMVDVVSDGLKCDVYTRGSYRTIKIQNDEMLLHESLRAGGSSGSEDDLSSGMPGKIVSVMVKNGENFKEGQPLLIMEAMKMENEMRAPRDGKVKKVHFKDGQNVESGALLISYEK